MERCSFIFGCYKEDTSPLKVVRPVRLIAHTTEWSDRMTRLFPVDRNNRNEMNPVKEAPEVDSLLQSDVFACCTGFHAKIDLNMRSRHD